MLGVNIILLRRIPLRADDPPKPWRRRVGFLGTTGLPVGLHDYMGVDLEAVWEATKRDLPELKRKIEIILEELSNNS